MSGHDIPHIDDDGVCECEMCVVENANAVWRTCPDCNVIEWKMHGVPTA